MKKLIALSMMALATVTITFGQAKMSTHSDRAAQAVNFAADAPTLLYSQMNAGTGTAIASQIFPDFGNCTMQGADDFTVPGGGWTIVRVEVIGTYSFHPGPANSFDVFFYADNAGAPGAQVYHGAGLAYGVNGSIFGVDLTTPAALAPGNYWVSVTPTMSFSVGGQWYWQSHVSPLIGNEFHWQDPCNLASSFTSWTTASVAFPGYGITDLCFALYGTSATVPVSDWALFIGLGLIVAFTVIRFRKAA
jgi:hypothetical protein